MNKIVVSSLLVLASLACRPIDKPESTTESVVYNYNKWENIKAVPVCIINRSAISDRLFNDVGYNVTQEFGSKVGIKLVGWGNCSTADLNRKMIRVYFNRSHDWNGVSGYSMIGASSNSCGKTCYGGTMRLDIGRSGDYPTTSNLNGVMISMRTLAIHEFGHALGLAHEHNRTDAPNCPRDTSKIGNGGAFTYVGKYDPKSIMNYCADPGIVGLSAGDIAGLKTLYPVLRSGNPTAPVESYYIVARHSGLCVNINRSSLANGGNVEQGTCNKSPAQVFQLVPGSGGSYLIRNVNSKKCIDVAGFSQNNTANIHQYTCADTTNQRIFLSPTSNGYNRFQFAHSKKCMDVSGASKAAGANIHQYQCANSLNQEFGFVRAN